MHSGAVRGGSAPPPNPPTPRQGGATDPSRTPPNWRLRRAGSAVWGVSRAAPPPLGRVRRFNKQQPPINHQGGGAEPPGEAARCLTSSGIFRPSN
eukprot:6695098-Alexandrium_andersonii.AAC.1